MTTHTAQVPLESHVNLVPVRVVVHDSRGNVVSDLRQSDFEIRQDGKPQVISHFSVETPASMAVRAVHGTPGEKPLETITPSTAPPAAGVALPSRFVALVVDDAHIDVGEIVRVRLAATRYLNQFVKPDERVALFTVSGQSQVDFTDDKSKIEEQLKLLVPRPVATASPASTDCLNITYFQADLIQNNNDQQANAAALADATACSDIERYPSQSKGPDLTSSARQADAQQMVAATVAIVLQAGNAGTQASVRRLDEIVRRISVMPGQRSLVLISGGFLTSTYDWEVSRLIDRAAQKNVFINTLDARGLYTVDSGDTLAQTVPLHGNGQAQALSAQYGIDQERHQSEVLADLADSTGGFYFRNNNDLDAGLRQTAAEPAVSYLLAFVPLGVKSDGKFHTISVKLLTKDHYTVQARRGFFAPTRGKTPEELAKQEIIDAVFSQDEQQGLPVQLHLQYLKVDEVNAKLAVLAHVDIGRMNFERSDGRNVDHLTIVAALFDRNGNYLSSDQKTLDMRLKDSTLEKLHQSGVTVKMNFEVKSGSYLLRLVVSDSKASQIASRNGLVEIP